MTGFDHITIALSALLGGWAAGRALRAELRTLATRVLRIEMHLNLSPAPPALAQEK